MNPMMIYLFGMTLMVILAVIFCLSISYYIKAKDLVPYLHKIEELVKKINELLREKEEEEKIIKDLHVQEVDAEKKIERGRLAEEWLKNSKDEIEQTQALLQKVRSEMQAEATQKADLDRQISERQQMLVDLNKKAIEADERVKEAEKSVEAIRQENAGLSVQVPKLKAEVEELKKEIESKKSTLQDLIKNITECADKLNKTRAELERLNALIEAKRKELERAESDIEKAKRQAKEAWGEVSELEGRAHQAQAVLSDLAAKREESGAKWKNLDTPVINESAMRKTGTTIVDENKWLLDFDSRLKQNGFIFDQRAIRAFHTGLKCAQQTPLVVLAGISGTGKSLLPELYAAALGMNFLSVPVQPRWDSPQDLFGFYNYMEGRYKATELARLLWQFDQYNGPARRRYNKQNLPLNLVLLDEMNLARVEYYFSDLLSKLETRNGLNPEDELERKKAEIELECNAADKADAMRHLFVSPYTLFVGTMNEDESTQTLSDKVIDRSNVLRFGRPKMFSGEGSDSTVKEPDKSSFIGSYSKDKRISASNWNAWCKTLDCASDEREDLKFLKQTVTPVLEALDKVYRPYGFRADKAMKLYVMNYPGNFKEAVADQIEMKILPKLNGVELQDEHFNDVKVAVMNAIEATKDDKLRDAFISACPDNGTFFKWRGVMR